MGGLPVTAVGEEPTVPADPGAAAPGQDVGGSGGTAVVQKVAWTLVWLTVASGGAAFGGAWSDGPWAVLLAPVLVVVGLAGAAAMWTVRRPLSAILQGSGLAAALVAAAVTQGTGIHVRHYVSTDSAAFNHVAARLLLEGRNPYTSSMAAAARLLHPTSAFWTYRVDGGHALGVSYPAGSFLLEAPLQAIGFTHMTTDWLDLAAWLAAAVLLFVLLPGTLRWLAPMLLLTGTFLGPFANGGTDALFLPFLVVAAWRWDRFPGRAAGRLPAWIGPACLGVACSIKQTPWFCVPFFVLGVGLVAARRVPADGSRTRLRTGTAVAGRYLAVVAAAFLLVDLPFIVWSPGAWLDGVLLPMIDPLVPDGQGVVALAVHGLTGGVVPGWLSVAGALAVAALLVALATWPARLLRSWLFFLPLVLALPGRSMTNYLVDLAPAALVAAVTVAPWSGCTPPAAAGAVRRTRRIGAVTVGALVVAAGAAVATGLTSAPLTVAVGQVSATGDPRSEDPMRWRQLTVTVTNRAGAPVTPRFMVAVGGGHPAGFWRADAVRGADPVPAGGTTVFALVPAVPTWTPTHGQAWTVQAYTTGPAALSTAPLQRWALGKPLH